MATVTAGHSLETESEQKTLLSQNVAVVGGLRR